MGLVPIDEVWLFGSHARGEAEAGSDVDVLVVSDRVETLPGATTDWLAKKYGKNVDIAQYSYGRLEALIKQGALFMWHLRCEGVPICRNRNQLAKMLLELEPYRRHREDLEVLLLVFEDAVASLSVGRATCFDLGVIATAIRNAGIIMHDLLGSRDFSPAAPVRMAALVGAPALPVSGEVYSRLSACRRASERGEQIKGGLPGQFEVKAMVDQLRGWLYGCIECAEVRVQ